MLETKNDIKIIFSIGRIITPQVINAYFPNFIEVRQQQFLLARQQHWQEHLHQI